MNALLQVLSSALSEEMIPSDSGPISRTFRFIQGNAGVPTLALERDLRAIVGQAWRTRRACDLQHDPTEFLQKLVTASETVTFPPDDQGLLVHLHVLRGKRAVCPSNCPGMTDGIMIDEPSRFPVVDISTSYFHKHTSVQGAFDALQIPEDFPEDFRNEYVCDQCQNDLLSQDHISLPLASNGVLIQIQRVGRVRQKDVKDKLLIKDLSIVLSVGQEDNSTIELDLSGVVLHRGASPAAGHYVALRKDAAGAWYLFDDNNIPGGPHGDVKKLVDQLHKDDSFDVVLLAYKRQRAPREEAAGRLGGSKRLGGSSSDRNLKRLRVDEGGGAASDGSSADGAGGADDPIRELSRSEPSVRRWITGAADTLSLTQCFPEAQVTTVPTSLRISGWRFGELQLNDAAGVGKGNHYFSDVFFDVWKEALKVAFAGENGYTDFLIADPRFLTVPQTERQRQLTRFDWSKYRVILFPWNSCVVGNKPNHWELFSLYPATRKIELRDSLRQGVIRPDATERIRIIQTEYDRRVHNSQRGVGNWVVTAVSSFPKQLNGCDCGAFLMIALLQAAKGVEAEFAGRPRSIKLFRTWLIAFLLEHAAEFTL